MGDHLPFGFWSTHLINRMIILFCCSIITEPLLSKANKTFLVFCLQVSDSGSHLASSLSCAISPLSSLNWLSVPHTGPHLEHAEHQTVLFHVYVWRYVRGFTHILVAEKEILQTKRGESPLKDLFCSLLTDFQSQISQWLLYLCEVDSTCWTMRHRMTASHVFMQICLLRDLFS